MTCVKTGAIVHIELRGETYRGDAFEVSDVMYFRLTTASEERGREPYGPADWIVENWENWFDRDKATSTLICDTLQTRKGGPRA